MNQDAIEIVDLGKSYRIGGQRHAYDTIRERITGLVSEFLSPNDVPDAKDTIWALRNLSLEIAKGEVVGIIGANGAGKSTLLKILSRITEPTEGSVKIRGKVGSLLEVGTGFHRELTGRENVYLNGAIMGMGKREIDSKLDAIVEFAQVEKFIDTPVKHYSTGMYTRLGFAVAAHLNFDILVVDEVLAVGDFSFQQKCLKKMDELSREQGRTVLFVSHNLASIRQLTEKCLWLDGGRCQEYGQTRDVADHYVSANYASSASGTVELSRAARFKPHLNLGKVRFSSVRLSNPKGDNTAVFAEKEPINIEVEFRVKAEVQLIEILCWIKTIDGAHLSSVMSGVQPFLSAPGVYTAVTCLAPNYFRPGRYCIDLVAYAGLTNTAVQDVVPTAAFFDIVYFPHPGEDPRYSQEDDLGVCRFEYSWGGISPAHKEPGGCR